MRDYDISALQQSYNSLHLTLSHFHYGALRGYSGTDTIYDSRLYFIARGQGDKYASITNPTRNEPNTPLQLECGNIYFMPRDTPVAFTFPRGFELVAVHFGLELFPGYDAFAGKTEFECCPDKDNLTEQLQSIPRARSFVDLRSLKRKPY